MLRYFYCWLLLTNVCLGSFSIYQWCKPTLHNCTIAQCRPGIYNDWSYFAIELSELLNSTTRSVCIVEDSKTSFTSQDSDGNTKWIAPIRFEIAKCSCKVDLPLDILDGVFNRCSRGSIKVKCQSCEKKDAVHHWDEEQALPICPLSTWFYKLIGAIFGVAVGAALIVMAVRIARGVRCARGPVSRNSSPSTRSPWLEQTAQCDVEFPPQYKDVVVDPPSSTPPPTYEEAVRVPTNSLTEV